MNDRKTLAPGSQFNPFNTCSTVLRRQSPLHNTSLSNEIFQFYLQSLPEPGVFLYTLGDMCLSIHSLCMGSDVSAPVMSSGH